MSNVRFDDTKPNDGLHPSSASGRQPPQHLFSTSSEDLRPASPPYRPVASSSNLRLALDEDYSFPPSPAYTPNFQMTPKDELTEKQALSSGSLPNNDSSHDKKPTVHYIDTSTPNVGPAPLYSRTDSADLLSNRTPSIAATDDDETEYDWSGEDDLADEEARFEQRIGGSRAKKERGCFMKTITFLFSTIIGSTLLAGVIVTPAILIHFYWYKPHPSEHRKYVKDNVQAWLFWAASNLVISWWLAMIVDILPVLARLFISLAWGHVSESVKNRLEIYDSIKNTIKPLLYAASGWVSWIIIFEHIYHLYNNPSPDWAPYTIRLYQVIEFFFFFALVLCAKQMLSHYVAFTFHRTAYKERIQELKEALTAIETLRQYRPKTPRHMKQKSSVARSSGTRTPAFGSGTATPLNEKEHFNSLSAALRSISPNPESKRRSQILAHDFADDADVEDGDTTLVNKGKGKQRKDADRRSWMQRFGDNSAPSTPPGILPHLEKDAESYPLSPFSAPHSAPMSAARSGEDSPHRYPPSIYTPEKVNSEEDAGAQVVKVAKVLKNAVLHDARNIQGANEGEGAMAWNISSSHEAKRLARAIYMRFKDRGRSYLLPSDFYRAFPTHEAAESAFRVFDKDNNGDISRAEIKTTCVKIYKERRFLSKSMRDVGAALRMLDNILLVFALIILGLIGISVFGVDVGDSLTSVYSLVVAASFIFKNSASSAFDAIMFLFVTHPYDTGDRVFVDQENLVVKKVGLFATVFQRSDGTETYYFNSQLFAKFITNCRRSGKTWENLTLQVAWKTPLEKLDALESCVNEWLSTEENRWFEPGVSIVLQHIDFQQSMTITMAMGHNGNWQDWGLRLQRKTAFHAAVLYYCQQLEIDCYASPIPVTFDEPNTSQRMPSPINSPPLQEEEPVMEPEHRKEAILGFIAPSHGRSAHLRARRTKSRKAAMRGMDG